MISFFLFILNNSFIKSVSLFAVIVFLIKQPCCVSGNVLIKTISYPEIILLDNISKS